MHNKCVTMEQYLTISGKTLLYFRQTLIMSAIKNQNPARAPPGYEECLFHTTDDNHREVDGYMAERDKLFG